MAACYARVRKLEAERSTLAARSCQGSKIEKLKQASLPLESAFVREGAARALDDHVGCPVAGCINPQPDHSCHRQNAEHARHVDNTVCGEATCYRPKNYVRKRMREIHTFIAAWLVSIAV